MFYVSFLITTKQKIIVNTQTIKKKEYKHSTKETQNTKQKIKKKKKRKTTKQLPNAGRGHQAPRKAAQCLRKEVGKNIKDILG